MQLLKLAIIPLIASVLFLGCTSQAPKTQSSASPTPSENTPTPNTTTLKAAVEELQIMQRKLEDGINHNTYSSLLAKTSPVVQHASGEAKAVAAMKSAIQGHKLALAFWQCDRIEGYEALHQCRGKVLSGIFTKYPDIKADAKAVVKGQNLSTISTGLDKENILQAIWKKTSADTEVANKAIPLDVTQREPNPS